MATTKLTITLDNDQLEEIRRLVGAGKASSISGFVRHAVGWRSTTPPDGRKCSSELSRRVAGR